MVYAAPPEVVVGSNGVVLQCEWRRNPDRPNVWLEIVRGNHVVLRSQRSFAVLLTVLQPGEQIWRARRVEHPRRIDGPQSVTNVRRKRIA